MENRLAQFMFKHVSPDNVSTLAESSTMSLGGLRVVWDYVFAELLYRHASAEHAATLLRTSARHVSKLLAWSEALAI